MKFFGIDDNSEAFSLLLTAIVGVLLSIFTYALNKRVMGSKQVQAETPSQVSFKYFNAHRFC